MGGYAGVNCTRAILAPEHISVLRSFAQRGVLLAFDYDGTLSPIAPTPESAHLPATTKRLLVRVAAQYPLVVISGRALHDISVRVADIGVRHVFGNHGFEWSGGKSRPRTQVHHWAEQLREQLSGHPGVFIEDKTHSLSVHYRLAPDQRARAPVHSADRPRLASGADYLRRGSREPVAQTWREQGGRSSPCARRDRL